MFTGIIEAALPVAAVEDTGGVRRLTVDLSKLPESGSIKLGDSVAINGCCLTVAALASARATFDVIPETLKLTNLGGLKAGGRVNVERAMVAGARLDGHFVQGHVDRVGEVTSAGTSGGEWRVRIRCGREFAAQCILKGSVCVDGMSLTIAELEPEILGVALIPHTRHVTNASDWGAGTRVNLEADMIGKYVRRQMGQA